MRDEMLTRAQADQRIRGSARVAACFCWVAALVALLVALSGAASAAFLTASSTERFGTDPLTAFLTTSSASGDFTMREHGERPPEIRYDEEGNEVGRMQVTGGTLYMAGSPIERLARGAVFGGLSCAAFVVAARMCSSVRRTGVVFSAERSRELGVVGWLVLLAGCVPSLLHMLLECAASAVVGALVEAGEMLSYALTARFDAQDLILVALGILLVLVSRVFEYGCILQKQDDETL